MSILRQAILDAAPDPVADNLRVFAFANEYWIIRPDGSITQLSQEASGLVSEFALNSVKVSTDNSLSPSYIPAASFTPIVWNPLTFVGNMDEFELQPDNTTILKKSDKDIHIAANLSFRRTVGSNRSLQFIQVWVSTDNGLNFIPLSDSTGIDYIREADANIGKSSPTIPTYLIQLPENTQIRLYAMIDSENAGTRDVHDEGYITLTKLSSGSDTTPLPIINNPLPATLELQENQTFQYDLQIVNADNVTTQGDPLGVVTIDNNGLLEITPSVTGSYPNFQVNASNDGGTVISPSDINVVGFQNLFKTNFNGIDQYGLVENRNQLNIDYNNETSIVFWVNILDLARANPFFQKLSFNGNNIDNGYLFWLDNNGRVNFRLSNSLNNFVHVRTNTVIVDDTRTCIVLTKDGTRLASGLNIYVNGALQSLNVVQDNLSNGTTSNLEDLYTGLNTQNGQIAHMNIDEIAWFDNNELDSVQIANIYNGGIPVDYTLAQYPTPSDQWRMGENANLGVIPNERSNANNRVLNLVNYNPLTSIIPF